MREFSERVKFVIFSVIPLKDMFNCMHQICTVPQEFCLPKAWKFDDINRKNKKSKTGTLISLGSFENTFKRYLYLFNHTKFSKSLTLYLVYSKYNQEKSVVMWIFLIVINLWFIPEINVSHVKVIMSRCFP